MHVLGLLSHCVDNGPGHLYFVIYEGEVLQGLARAGGWRGGYTRENEALSKTSRWAIQVEFLTRSEHCYVILARVGCSGDYQMWWWYSRLWVILQIEGSV